MLFAAKRPTNSWKEYQPPQQQRQVRANSWSGQRHRETRTSLKLNQTQKRNRYRSTLLESLATHNITLATAITSLLLLLTPTKAVSTGMKTTSTPFYRIATTDCGDLQLTPQHPDVPKVYHYLKKHTREKRPLQMAEALVYQTHYGKTLAAIGAKETNMIAGRVGASGEQGKFQLMGNWLPENYNPKDDVQNVKLAEKVLTLKIKMRKGNWRKGIIAYNGAGPKARAYGADVARRVRMINNYA